MIELGPNRYGKARVHVVRVHRGAGPDGSDVVRDVMVRIALEGDFERAHTEGDNELVVATDTMKNTCYVVAKDHLGGALEEYGSALAEHFLAFPQVSRASAYLEERAWDPLQTTSGPAGDAFVRAGDLVRTAVVVATRDGLDVSAGIAEMIVMKTRGSAFSGFPRDRYTTLAETDDRIMATSVTASWRYAPGRHDWDVAWERAVAAFCDTFTSHHSPSVQASIWAVGRAMLEAEPAIAEIHFELPNLHHWPFDVERFGMANDFEVFVATDEPHGLIEATVRRVEAAP